MIKDLTEDLCDVTGFAGLSLQPNAGSQVIPHPHPTPPHLLPSFLFVVLIFVISFFVFIG
jgi:hypothetical protein